MRTLKSALESDCIVQKIYSPNSKTIRVDVKRRFYDIARKNFKSFWINRKYFIRTYPNLARANGLI